MNFGEYWYLILFLIVVVVLGLIFFTVFNLKQKNSGGKNNLLNPFDDEEDVTEDEIMTMVNESHEQGNILASEAEMINNIFELEEKVAKDIMVHRTGIIAVNCEDTLVDVLDFMLGTSHSRFPVYDGDIDNITGILHIRDMIVYYRNPDNANVPIKDLYGLIRNVTFIPETRDINTLFKMMQTKKEHMVIVIDEYGQTAGLVALEDILEEIVGNIEDEYDNEPVLIEEKEPGVYIMKGMTPVDEAFEILGIPEEEDAEYDTLNGLIISCLEHIPEESEETVIKYAGYEFRVLSIENKRINEVKVVKLEENDTED